MRYLKKEPMVELESALTNGLETQSSHRGCKSLSSIVVIGLALYSTIFSGIFLVVSLCKYRYTFIHRGGSMSPSQAGLLTAFLAKTIETFSTTVFITFLGQVLSRRAFGRSQACGTTLIDMNLRSLVMQPGRLVTHLSSFRYSITSMLGALTLLATLLAMLYTTASEALGGFLSQDIQPKLAAVSSDIVLQGLVKSIFANPTYLAEQCITPVATTVDRLAEASCLVIRFAYQANLDLQNYLGQWEPVVGSGLYFSDRPSPVTQFYENNTRVVSSWVQSDDDNLKNWSRYGRVVDNVTLAVPHIGVVTAAQDSRNGILQLEDLDGQANYSLEATVSSPMVNVLCANMKQEELAPIVYAEWSNTTLNATEWPTGEQLAFYQPGDTINGTYLNKTVVDDLFGWGEKYKTSPPVFAKLPIAYNTLMNHTGAYGRKAVYLLGRSGRSEQNGDYTLCSLKAYETPSCRTRYNSSASGDTIESLCPGSQLRVPHLLDEEHTFPSQDWPYMATQWADSISLNDGMVDAQASMARLLTQLALESPVLPHDRPSLAEALAVLASGTLLMAAEDTQFHGIWTYSRTVLDPGQYQVMNATLLAKGYMSGSGALPATNAFNAVLAATFLSNLLCLGYFIRHSGLVTDFSEPFNLFALAINSPPSAMMAGSSTTGPSTKQVLEKWFIDAQGEELVLESYRDHDNVEEVIEPEEYTPPYERSLLYHIRRIKWLRKATVTPAKALYTRYSKQGTDVQTEERTI
ncbi:hypothetical protein E4T50_15136 [Aureobasidium sp. EXF-12298]|nr:hypothetical protein E4T50_15136 [Aureobasidium sp. EXF-12298]